MREGSQPAAMTLDRDLAPGGAGESRPVPYAGRPVAPASHIRSTRLAGGPPQHPDDQRVIGQPVIFFGRAGA